MSDSSSDRIFILQFHGAEENLGGDDKYVHDDNLSVYLTKIPSNLESHHLVMLPTVRIDCLGPILTKPVSDASANKPTGSKHSDHITRERRSPTSSSFQLGCVQLPWSNLRC